MKNKKQIIILASGIFLMVIVITFILVSSRKNIILNEHTRKNIINNKMLSIMVETIKGSGEYEPYNGSSWPEGIFNENLSSCENGSTLTWNEDTGAVSLNTNISDKCYVYFDALPADVEIAVANRPTTVGAQASLTCSDATSTYNQKYNRIEISGINNKRTACYLTFTQRTTIITYLADRIIGLAGSTQGTGQVVNENGYRYEGKNPNNYVWFNNELWRIIGVFDSATHGVANTNLVKIIRANPIGGLAWNSANTNDWANSSLYKLLNPVSGDSNSGSYYNKTNGTSSGYCRGYSTTGANCDYTGTGIESNYRSMIKKVTWKVGGHTTYAATSSTFYTAERGSATGNSNSYAATVEGYIGLMYPSDYGYSVLASSCARTINLGSYNTQACAGSSWLYGQGYEWTMTPDSSNFSSVFSVIHRSQVLNNSATNGYAVRPSLYLDVNVYVIDGTGSEDDPYIIGM